MKILVDMNLSPDWVNFLNAAGHHAIHWSMIGSGSTTDDEVMTWAANKDHIVLTADLDFGAILATTKGTRQASSRCVTTSSRPALSATSWHRHCGRRSRN